MSSLNSKTAKNFIKTVFTLGLITWAPLVSAWEVDLSRRQLDFQRISNESRLPASTVESTPIGLMDKALESVGPAQDIVIMNTEKGFVPEAVSVRQGGQYRIHIVNVNEGQKNVSFVLDAFSEYHNNLYGKTKTFTLSPKASGVFSYQCPETAMQGKLIVVPDGRQPASSH